MICYANSSQQLSLVMIHLLFLEQKREGRIEREMFCLLLGRKGEGQRIPPASVVSQLQTLKLISLPQLQVIFMPKWNKKLGGCHILIFINAKAIKNPFVVLMLELFTVLLLLKNNMLKSDSPHPTP